MKEEWLAELEKALGYDQVKPIQLPESMQKEIDQENDYFESLYKEEMWAIYQKVKSEE